VEMGFKAALLLSACLLRSSFSAVYFSVASPPSAPDFATLDSVLRQAETMSAVQVDLVLSGQEFPLQEAALIPHSVRVIGHTQVVRLKKGIYVGSQGKLRLEDMRLVAGEMTGAAVVFEIAGLCELVQVAIEWLAVPGFWVYGGLVLNEVRMVGNSAVTLTAKSQSASFTLTSVEVSSLTSTFFASTWPLQVSLTNCSFINNRLEDQQPLFSLVGVSGVFSMLACLFQGTQGTLIQVNGKNLYITWTNCAFEANNGSLLSGYMSNSTVQMSDTELRDNAQVAVRLLQFDGDFRLSNSSVSGHKSGGVFGLYNSLSPELCRVYFSNSSFSHFSIPYFYPIPGVLLISSCLGHLSNLTLVNATMVSNRDLQVDSLVGAIRGSLWLDGLTATDSGSTGYLIGVNIGDLHMTNFNITNPYTGQGMYIGVSDGSVAILHGSITQGAFYNLGFKRLYLDDPVYVGVMVSRLYVEDISVFRSSIDMGVVFAAISSTFEIHNVSLAELTVGSAMVGSYSSGQISALYMQQLTFKMHTFQPGIASEILISDISLLNSRVMYSSRGIMQISLKTKFTLLRASFVNVTAGAFVRSKHSVFVAVQVSIDSCRFDLLLNNPIMSNISFEGLSVRNTETALAFLTNCHVSFTNSVFQTIHSHSLFMLVYTSHLSFTNATVTSLLTTEMGKVMESSTLEIKQSLFSELKASGEQGWKVFESWLRVVDSKFSRFDMSLFQCSHSNVSIQHSKFEDGYSPVVSLRSNSAFGGVLGCMDCPLVTILAMRAFNISAKVGGVLSLRGYHNSTLFASISESLFVVCTASRAGAIFISDSSFLLSACRFSGNRAESSGGAVQAVLHSNCSGLIRDSVFIYNSASEGGALKWFNTPITLVNVSFHSNSADYGPDVASYGVALSSQLTIAAGHDAPGLSVTLQFELLDHYNHRVTTSLFDSFVLLDTPTVTYRGNHAAILNKGLFLYRDLVIYAAPASKHSLTGYLNYTQEGKRVSVLGSAEVSFRNCSVGEIYRPDRCEVCYAGSVSFSPTDSNCTVCPLFAHCAGGNQLSVNSGYWRNYTNSTELRKCPLADKCVESSCAQGYTGLLCTQCAAGTRRIRVLECQACSELYLELAKGSVLVSEIGLFVWAVRRFAVTCPSPPRLFVLKSALHHVQLITVISFFRMSYSSPLTKFVQGLNYVGSLLLVELPLACFGDKSAEYTKAVVGSMLLPLVSLLYFAFLCLRRRQNRVEVIVLVSSFGLFTSFIVLAVTFPLLICESEGSSKLLMVDTSVKCWGGTHLLLVYALVLPSLLINVCGPLLVVLAWGLVRPKSFQQYFPLWTSGYRWPLWEVFVYVTKGLVLVVCTASLSFNPLTQVLCCFAILIPACVVNAAVADYAFQCRKCFFLSQGSYLTLAITCGLLAFYSYYLPGQRDNEMVVIVLVLLLNNAYFLGSGYLAVRWREMETMDVVTRVIPSTQTVEYERSDLFVPPNSPVCVC